MHIHLLRILLLATISLPKMGMLNRFHSESVTLNNLSSSLWIMHFFMEMDELLSWCLFESFFFFLISNNSLKKTTHVHKECTVGTNYTLS
jgi:hypothetical protein